MSASLSLLERLDELLTVVDEEEDYARAIPLCEALLQDMDSTDTTSTADTATTTATTDGNLDLVLIVQEIYFKCLLHESKFQQLLKQHINTINTNTSTGSKNDRLTVLQAYAYYRLEHYEKALQLAQECPQSSTAAQHIKAQAFHHLHQNTRAMQAYQTLLQTSTKSCTDQDNQDNDDNQMELYTNAMAVITANATPYLTDDKHQQVTEQATQTLLNQQQDTNMEYPYDLAYNLATHALLTANTHAKRHKAITLMKQAHKTCTDDPREIKPILINLTWGNILWGEPTSTAANSNSNSNVNTKTNKNKNKTNTPSEKIMTLIQDVIQPNLIQLPALNKKTLQKLIQALQSLLPDDTSTTKPKLSPLQLKICYYNLALTQLQAKQYQQCRDTLQSFAQTTLHTDIAVNKKKKKKNNNNNAESNDSNTNDTIWWQVRVQVLMAYSLYYQQQQIQQQMLQSEESGDDDDDDDDDSNDDPASDNANVDKQFQDAIDKLQRRCDTLKQENTKDDDSTLVYLQLHLMQLNSNNNKSQAATAQQQWLLQQVQSQDAVTHPAMIATLAKTYQDQNQTERAKDLLMKLNDDADSNANGNQIMAEMAMAQGNYEEAVQFYQLILTAEPNNLAIRARMVEALAHVDPARALQEWKTMEQTEMDQEEDDDDEEEEDLDGQELEQRALPRIKHDAAAAGLTSSATAGTDAAAANKNQTKSQAAVVRRRAKKRQEYLDKLTQKGLYNPLKPTRPDPERWIPKHERQRSRRRNKQQHKGAQGGISSKDAAKLDVAARANNSNFNNSAAASGPSTAHLTVAGNARKGGGRRR